MVSVRRRGKKKKNADTRHLVTHKNILICVYREDRTPPSSFLAYSSLALRRKKENKVYGDTMRYERIASWVIFRRWIEERRRSTPRWGFIGGWQVADRACFTLIIATLLSADADECVKEPEEEERKKESRPRPPLIEYNVIDVASMNDRLHF